MRILRSRRGSSGLQAAINWTHLLRALLIVALILGTSNTGQADNDAPRAHPALLQLAEEHPDETFMVIIQREVKNKALQDDDPEVAVEKAGGKVKKQLAMIESFAAELTGKEIKKLAKHPKVRWITFDAPLVSTAAGDPTVRDEFATAAYSNNNGTQSWTGNWSETGDGTASATSGYVKIASGQLQLSSTNRTLSRQANLAGVASATLSFQYKRSGLDDANDYVAVQVSTNGGSTWTELARYAGAGTDSAWQSASFNIVNYAAANTQLRFATSSSLGIADILYVDNVQIEYALPAPTSTPTNTPMPAATPTPTATPAPAGSFVVNSTADSADAHTGDGVCQTSTAGQCTLRAAMQQANATSGKNTIIFNIAGAGPHTIQPASALPIITDPVVIDGSSEPDFATNGNKPIVVLDGNGLAADGLVFSSTADGSTLRSLVIRDFGTTTSHDAIEIQVGSDGNTIAGNYIGRLTTTGADAGSSEANSGSGINLRGSSNTIGGMTAANRNVIAGNVDGIYMQGASGNTIIGNYIGTDATGMFDLGNTDRGVQIESGSHNNSIGGTASAARNIISGNDNTGVIISDGASPGLGVTGNIVQGNYIGVAADGPTALANQAHGIHITNNADNNIVGGTLASAGNVIANNQWRGVNIQDTNSTGNVILGNSIYANGLTGIDLEDNGVTTNNGAVGAGANNGMDYPVITSGSISGCWLNVLGYVGSAANQNAFANARVEFFKSSADSSGYGEGQTYLGYLMADVWGNFSGNLLVRGLAAGDRLTATATDSNNNTSEFALNYQVTYAEGSCGSSPFAGAVRADQLWNTLQGQGIGVAVVDSGINSVADLQDRVVANNNQTTAPNANDNYVHGTHVAGIIGGNGSYSIFGANTGVAPQVNLINVKVSNDVGNATTSDLIDGLQWILANKAAYNIRVVNISLNATVAESYHTSPLDAAVEILWFNGIAVVVAAGNNGAGSGPVTLYPPANDPFVITVGAADGAGTPALSDDTMATFSAYGTTEDGFAKPDLVAPGRNLISLLASTSATGYVNHPAHRVDSYYFRMSGTSMAAPVVSGAVALLLQDEPNLTPDQVKYRLKATANTAWPGYDAAKSGAGYLDAYAAVYGTTTESANTGLTASQLLTTGSEPITSVVSWNSVSWNSVSWNSVSWNSVSWNSVSWNSVSWNSAVWDDAPVGASSVMGNDAMTLPDSSTTLPAAEEQSHTVFLPMISQ